MKAVWEVFWRFLILGCFSFGGPAAHMGYFRQAFVEKLKWLDDDAYGKLIALSQFLPGPGSSQVGFAVGLQRAGLAGGIAAFVGFTLPSCLLIYFAATLSANSESVWINGLIHGLKLLAVVVVADATLGMAKNFCKNKTAYTIAVFTALALLLFPSLLVQLIVLALAGVVGMSLLKPEQATINQNQTSGIRILPLALFALLLFGLPFIAHEHIWLGLFSDFYQSGSLVFGGGHVVLPLLQQTLGESVDTDRFLLGYAFAQAVPGPMFTMATFLGAEVMPNQSLLGALTATLAIFLPGFLLVLALHNAWQNLASKPKIAGAAAGINAAVVGLLLSALYNPVFVSAVFNSWDFAVIVLGFFALRVLQLPILVLVAGFALAGIGLSFI